MGLIKAALGATGGTLADQWKDYFYCDAMPDDVLMMKGEKRNSGRSSNRRGNDNIITTGSVIAVADGQCMLIVEQGKVVDVCAEPGDYTFDSETEPTIITGDLDVNLPKVFETVAKRFTFGGEAPNDQRIYYFNTREIMGNKYGTPNPIIFRISDPQAGINVDMPIRCFGEYSFRITNPLLFYTNVAGNAGDDYTLDRIQGQMKSELLDALQPAFARLSAQGINYAELMGRTKDIRNELSAELSELWGKDRGIEIVHFGVSSMKGDEKVEDQLRTIQLYRNNPGSMAAELGKAQADSMRAAASNTGGSAMAFMGMGMANQAGGMNPNDLYQMGQTQQAQAQAQQDLWTCACGARVKGNFCPQCGKPKPQPKGSWTCECGATVTGNFCPECGKPKPQPKMGWTCKCGATNKGKFCSECGAPKPAGVPQYKCDKCGWEPEDPAHPPKFCPECGDPFDDGDLKN